MDINYLIFVVPFLYLVLRIIYRLSKNEKKSDRHFTRALIYFALFFLTIISVHFDETYLENKELSITNNTTDLENTSASLASSVVLWAAAIALVEGFDSGIEYYDKKKKESPLFFLDFFWCSLFLSINLVPLFVLLACAFKLDALTGFIFTIVFLTIIILFFLVICSSFWREGKSGELEQKDVHGE
jgi:hypothetical protein